MSLVRAARKIARIYAIAIIGCLAVGYLALSVLGGQRPGPVDQNASRQIHKLCATRPDCDVRLRDIVPGDYDTFYEFGPYQQQDEVNQELGTTDIHVSDLHRILVFKRDGKIQQTQYADFGIERPMDGEVVFDEEFSSPEPAWVKYAPDQLLRVTACDTHGNGALWALHTGTYYLLTPAPLRPAEVPTCQALF